MKTGCTSAVTAAVLLVLISTAAIPGQDAPSSDEDDMVWSGIVDLDKNVTVEKGEKLIVESGTEVRFGPDIFVTVEGEVHCGGIEDDPVRLNNTHDRMSGGFVLLNSEQGRFEHCIFTNFSVAVLSVYSDIHMDGCAINRSGIGVFSHQGHLDMSDTRFDDCDVAVDLVLTTARLQGCAFSNNLQSLTAYNDESRIGAFLKFAMSSVEQDRDMTHDLSNYTWEVRNCTFSDTGIGFSAVMVDDVVVDGCTFDSCKKGIHLKHTPGLVRGCVFQGNKMDFEVQGWGVEIEDYDLDDPERPHSFYSVFDVELNDLKGDPLGKTFVVFQHQGSSRVSYMTDGSGVLHNVTLLSSRVMDGKMEDYDEYIVYVKDEQFPGNITLTLSEVEGQSVELDPGDFAGGSEDDPMDPDDRMWFLVLIFVAALGIVAVYLMVVKRIG